MTMLLIQLRRQCPDWAEIIDDMDETPHCYSFEQDDYDGDGDDEEDDDE